MAVLCLEGSGVPLQETQRNCENKHRAIMREERPIDVRLRGRHGPRVPAEAWNSVWLYGSRRNLRVCGCEVAALRPGQDNVGEQVYRRGSLCFSRTIHYYLYMSRSI